jgi:D-amino-acid dehydrogenase
VFYNTGHGHLGWTLAAATAQRAAEALEQAMPMGQRIAAKPGADTA